MDELKEPIEPTAYTLTGDKAKDEAGETAYQESKTKYDSELLEYNTKKSEKENNTSIEENNKIIEGIRADKNLTEKEKALAIKSIEGIPSIEAKKETPKEEDKIPVISEEDKNYINIVKTLRSNPSTAIYLDSLINGNIEKTLAELLPKGEDISKLSDEQVYERSLIVDGYSVDEIKDEMDSFKELKGKKKRDAINEAKDKLSKSSPNIPEKLAEKLKMQNEATESVKIADSKTIQYADTQLNKFTDTLIGKEYNGVSVSSDDIESLQATIVDCTPRNFTPQGLKMNLEKGFDLGLKAFLFEKVTKSKDKKILELEQENKDYQTLLAKRFRVSDASYAGNGTSKTTIKTDINPKTGKVFW